MGAPAAMPTPAAAAATAAAVTAAAQAVPKVAIADDLSITRVIKGCWQLSGGHRGDKETDRTVGAAAVQDFAAFADAGITTWDCADHYGPAELLIGRYLRENPQQVPNIQVLTKLCLFSGAEMVSVNQKAIDRGVDASLSRLGTKSVDVMQFYWGDYGIPRYTDAFKYLGDSQAAGKVRHLGVTNFDVKRCQELADTGVRLATNQLQYSLLDTRPQNGMADFCVRNGVAMLPYGVLAGGFLSDRYLGVPVKDVRVDTSSKSKYGAVILRRGGWDWFQLLLGALDGIAKKHGSTIANVSAKWVLDQPGVAGVILGARNANHITDQVALSALTLDAADKDTIAAVLEQGTRPKGDCYQWERGIGPF